MAKQIRVVCPKCGWLNQFNRSEFRKGIKNSCHRCQERIASTTNDWNPMLQKDGKIERIARTDQGLGQLTE